jgi:hypothetical protein
MKPVFLSKSIEGTHPGHCAHARVRRCCCPCCTPACAQKWAGDRSGRARGAQQGKGGALSLPRPWLARGRRDGVARVGGGAVPAGLRALPYVQSGREGAPPLASGPLPHSAYPPPTRTRDVIVASLAATPFRTPAFVHPPFYIRARLPRLGCAQRGGGARERWGSAAQAEMRFPPCLRARVAPSTQPHCTDGDMQGEKRAPSHSPRPSFAWHLCTQNGTCRAASGIARGRGSPLVYHLREGEGRFMSPTWRPIPAPA